MRLISLLVSAAILAGGVTAIHGDGARADDRERARADNETAARADDGERARADGRCIVADTLLAAPPLPHTAEALALRKTLVVVALGSSSTAGAGASTPQASYPARLEANLRRLYPAARVRVVNRGLNGDTVDNMAARLDRDVLALKPELVVWQTGVNDAMRGLPVADFRRLLDQGLAKLSAAGVDVVLMSPQMAPRYDSAPQAAPYLAQFDEVARDGKAALFRRHAIMHDLARSGRMAVPDMVSADGLHMTDLSYDCTGRLLARLIARGASSRLTLGKASPVEDHPGH